MKSGDLKRDNRRNQGLRETGGHIGGNGRKKEGRTKQIETCLAQRGKQIVKRRELKREIKKINETLRQKKRQGRKEHEEQTNKQMYETKREEIIEGGKA